MINKDIFNKKAQLVTGSSGRESAVLIPLIEKNGQDYVLFEVRSGKLKQQPSEICFPGGRMEDNEEAYETAIRETSEELCIETDKIEILGETDGSIGPGNMPVWAYAGRLHQYESTFSKDEVDHIFLVPLQDLLSIEPHKGYVDVNSVPDPDFPVHLLPNQQSYKWRSARREILFYEWNEYVIWGLTARILHSFLQRIRS